MGKAPDTTRRKKKKGRPSLLDLQRRALEQKQLQQQHQQPDRYTRHYHTSPDSQFSQNPSRHDRTPTPPLLRRSSRRNHNLGFASLVEEFDDEEEDERTQKKVKLVGRLPSDDQVPPKSSAISSSFNLFACNSHSLPEDGDGNFDTLSSNRKLNAVNSGYGCLKERGKVPKATESGNGTGSALQDGPTAPLPDRKLLLLILDKLQKKDTRGVFAEPVDPEELPDYHEVIKKPMDFDTVRKNLDKGTYANLEQLEADIYLICSNAMQYNPPHTIYFRQARSIQELAKKEFEIVRQGDAEAPPKVARRGRPPKKAIESSPADHLKASTDATLANLGDDALRSNTYNLRKGPSLHRYHLPEAISRRSVSGGPHSVEGHFEFQAPKAVSTRSSKKHFALDEGKRDTYHQSVAFASGDSSSALSIAEGEVKQLIPVGLHVEQYSYVSSLARFSANVGPMVWRFASQKIRSILPAGVDFGPGWMEETDASSLSLLCQPTLPNKMVLSPESSVHGSNTDSTQQQSILGSTSFPVGDKSSNLYSSEDMMLGKGLNNHHQISLSNSAKGMAAGGTGYGPSFQAQHQRHQEPPIRSGMNGLQCESGFDFGPQERELMGPIASTANPSYMGSQLSNQMNAMGIRHQMFDSSSFNRPGNYSRVNSLPAGVTGMGLQHVKPTWQDLSMYRRWNLSSIPPDLNVKIQTSKSPSSSVHIGSPPQLDLMLQL